MNGNEQVPSEAQEAVTKALSEASLLGRWHIGELHAALKYVAHRDLESERTKKLAARAIARINRRQKARSLEVARVVAITRCTVDEAKKMEPRELKRVLSGRLESVPQPWRRSAGDIFLSLENRTQTKSGRPR